MRIHNDSYDLDMPTRDDVLSELKQVKVHALSKFIPTNSPSLTDMWLRNVQISDILGHVLQIHYRVKGPEPSPVEVDQASRLLDGLALGADLDNENDDIRIHTLQTELLYQ